MRKIRDNKGVLFYIPVIVIEADVVPLTSVIMPKPEASLPFNFSNGLEYV